MVIKSEKYYRIRHVPSGLFKANGFNGDFNRVGKLWKGRNLKAHLRQFESYKQKKDGVPLVNQIDKVYHNERMRKQKRSFALDDCVIDEFELVPYGSRPLRDFIENEMENKND